MRLFGLDPLDLFRYGGQDLLWDRAARGALSIAGPVIAGIVFGNADAALIATVAALWLWLNDLGGALEDRLINMATSCAAVLCGGLLAYALDAHYWTQLAGLFLLSIAIGWVHSTSRGLENAARHLGFAFAIVASLQLADPMLILLAFVGAGWAALVAVADTWLRRRHVVATGSSCRAGFELLFGPHEPDWRFGLRYAIAAALGLGLAEQIGATHAAWVTITTLAVMRPTDSESVQLVLQRGFGTLIGIGLALGIVSISHNLWHLAFWVVAFAFCISPGMIWQRWSGFAAITAAVMVLLDMALLAEGGDRPLLPERLYDTGLGCVIALAATWLIFPARWRR
jgi:hypothetical protein